MALGQLIIVVPKELLLFLEWVCIDHLFPWFDFALNRAFNQGVCVETYCSISAVQLPSLSHELIVKLLEIGGLGFQDKVNIIGTRLSPIDFFLFTQIAL